MAGCIIRSAMLDDIAEIYSADRPSSLLADPTFVNRLRPLVQALRNVVAASAIDGAPAPALSAALSYIDQLARPRGTANLIQGLRDCFGKHGFERIDREGKGFHGPWADTQF